MASPVSDSYSASSGGVIAGGRYRFPAWRRAIASGGVAQVGSNKISDIDPEDNAAINPNHPSEAPWHGAGSQSAIVYAWCGAAYNAETGVYAIPIGGGHSDYAGNEGYLLNLLADSPTWTMPRNPSGAIGNTITLNDGQEATGNYSDGRPRAVHTYNSLVYVPNVGIVQSVQGHSSYSSASGGTMRSMLYDEDTGEWSSVATRTNASVEGHGACYDSTRNCIWHQSQAEGHINKLNCSTWSWTYNPAWSATEIYNDAALQYAPSLDLVIKVQGNVSGGFCLRNPSSGALYTPGTTGTMPTGLRFNGKAGVQWSETHGCLCLWDNTSNGNVIATLTPQSNPLTQAWVWGSMSFSGTTVSAATSNGTFNRFIRCDNLDGFVLLNSVGEKAFFFAD